MFETGSLLGIALDAARSIKAPSRQGRQRPALISIVFSVVALEAFINELTERALDASNIRSRSDPGAHLLSKCGQSVPKGSQAEDTEPGNLNLWLQL
jgi:hypothetical protein